MRVQHPLAGGQTVANDDLWEFPEGLLGFPDLRRFALVSILGAEPFRLLASVDRPDFALVVVKPQVFVSQYELELSAAEVAPLALEDPRDAEILATVVLPAKEEPLRLNLRGPIVMNPRTRRGVQRVSAHPAHETLEISRQDAANATPCSF